MFEDVAAMEKPLFRRVSASHYEVLNSDETHYYTVHLLQGKPLDCECRSWKFRHECHHVQIAEEAESQVEESRLKAAEETEEVFTF